MPPLKSSGPLPVIPQAMTLINTSFKKDFISTWKDGRKQIKMLVKLRHRKLSECCKALELEGRSINYNVPEFVGITKHTWPLMLEIQFYILPDAKTFQVLSRRLV